MPKFSIAYAKEAIHPSAFCPHPSALKMGYTSFMKPKRALSLFFALISGLVLCSWFVFQPLLLFSQETQTGETAVSLPPPIAKLDNALSQQLTAAAPDETIRVIIYLDEQVDIAQLAQTGQPTAQSHAQLVTELQQTAVTSQQNLLSALDHMQQSGAVSASRPLWIINAVAASATPAGITDLASRSDVAIIRLDEAQPLIQLPLQAEKLAQTWQTTAAAIAGEPWGIGRVQAPYAWHGLGIDGAGITVGIMDSGVDWQHPDLLPNYRGNMGGGIYDHGGNWYDAVVPTMTVPHDVQGHGTHVAGTAVGQNGIGVAPGASWIAVNIANEYGFIYDSDVHAGFQWLLAPANNPSLAPDVVNGSWAGPGYVTAFIPDIQALDAAGIITVFAASNSGPGSGTIGAPASYEETIAAGAHDDTNALTWFSSRGPSPLHAAYAPHLTAPGTAIYSSLPDGGYGYYNGTSMAAPHTTGAVALILAADNSLSRQEVTHILTETAVSISTTHPNMDSGWGRLNAYQAVVQVTQHGTLTGIVRENGLPLPGIVVTVTTSMGFEMGFETDVNGRYTTYLQPGTYQIKTSPFGYTPLLMSNIPVTVQNTMIRDMTLTRLASGRLIVQVFDASTSLPIQATIDILGTPLTLETTPNGTIDVLLPTGTYDLRVSEAGYEIGHLSVTLVQNQTTTRAISLTPTKKVLLVDTGAWYYRSYRTYFEESLLNLGYAYDSLIVTNPAYPAFPDQTEINSYDVVVWTAPSDSPGYIGANNVITDFLGQGGNMLISGQNVGAYDGYGFDTQLWWYRDLQGNFLGELDDTQTITGAANTVYEGLTVTLNGSDSANNQSYTDVSSPKANSLAEEIFYAEDDYAVGLQAGHCQPFRLSYFGFGLEGVAGAANRDALMAQSFAYFDTPRQETGLLWRPAAIDDFAPPGEALVYPVHMKHLGELITDTYSLRIDNALWPVALNATAVELGPCASDLVTVTVQIPANLPRNIVHEFEITAVSQNDPSVQVSLPIHHKTPDHILLVDDDRWYNQEAIYRAALTEAGFTFDEWDIGWDNNIKGSPPLSLLNAYDAIIWYTGYDWFAPITSQENKTLAAYLAQGGRLFLSSQDFLYYNHTTPLAKTYLGIIDYQESITPTLIYQGHPAMPPNLAEPLPLTYTNFKNNGDGLAWGPYAAPFVWHDQGMAAGVANSNSPQASTLYRTLFFGFPFEKLPTESHAPIMNSIVGWLSDLGDSTFTVDQPSGNGSDPRTYTLTLRNNPLAGNNQIIITNTLPVSLTLQPASLSGGAVYHAASRQIRWQGQLTSGEAHSITYQAYPSPALPDGVRVDNLVTIGYEKHNLAFNRVASFWTNTPDLSRSTLSAETNSEGSKQIVTYTLSIQNSNLMMADVVTATLKTPEYLHIGNILLAELVGQLIELENEIIWTGALEAGEGVTITLTTSRTMAVDEPEWLTAVATIENGVTPPLIRATQSHLPPFKHYFPVIAQNN